MNQLTIELRDNELAANLAGASSHDLRWLLMDALAEYVAHRAHGNGRDYVDQRYPGNDVYPEGPAREAKVALVDKRCRFASAIKNSIGTVRIEPID